MYSCVRDTSYTKMVWWPSNTPAGGIGLTPDGVGINVSGGLHLVLKHECLERDSLWYQGDSQ
jgi:hypothetical protein